MEKYKALKGYFNDKGLLEMMPGKKQKKKLELMLQYLAEQFKPGIKYTEKEVNDILNRYHSFKDPATLRRLMFGSKIFGRTIDGRQYWLTDN